MCAYFSVEAEALEGSVISSGFLHYRFTCKSVRREPHELTNGEVAEPHLSTKPEQQKRDTTRLHIYADIPTNDRERLEYALKALDTEKKVSKTAFFLKALRVWLDVTADDVSWPEAKKRAIAPFVQEARMTPAKIPTFIEVAKFGRVLLESELPMIVTREQLDRLDEAISPFLDAIRKAKTRCR